MYYYFQIIVLNKRIETTTMVTMVRRVSIIPISTVVM